MADARAMRHRAQQIADEVLFPSARDVDRFGQLPRSHLDLLAAKGFYGIAAPPEHGGLGVEDLESAGSIIEAFAGGCLSAAFVWIQHHGAVIAASYADSAVRERWLDALAAGQRRAGVALAGVRPGPDQVKVRHTEDVWVISGSAPWVTGWGLIDTLYLAAVDAADVIHFFLVDAVEQPGMTIKQPKLMAAQASSTVEVTFDDHLVPEDRWVRSVPAAEWAASNASGSALNGFLALGVARRCARLIETDAFDAELESCRQALLAADSDHTPAARARTSYLAYRVAGALAVHTGSRAALSDEHADRLLREAGFLLVFGSRPPITSDLLARLSGG